jgi:hypothetical protein
MRTWSVYLSIFQSDDSSFQVQYSTIPPTSRASLSRGAKAKVAMQWSLTTAFSEHSQVATREQSALERESGDLFGL